MEFKTLIVHDKKHSKKLLSDQVENLYWKVCTIGIQNRTNRLKIPKGTAKTVLVL